MHYFDVCNGDADGLIARHQYRLSFPVAGTDLTLLTGSKRETSLLSRVDTSRNETNGTDISVFDISYDRNAESARRLLEGGASIRYFDHHRAARFQPHPRLAAHIDTSADVCTSLIVDRYLEGAHHAWAIAGAFGDNLIEVAEQLAANAHMAAEEALTLRQLGEYINYNAYGESIRDLRYAPAEIARRMLPYRSPFAFVQCEDIFVRLQIGFTADLRRARAVQPLYTSSMIAVYLLPDEPWAKRVSGAFANLLASACKARAHAVLSRTTTGTYTVSIRAPQDNPQHANIIAEAFINGGGRAGAAGINNLPDNEITRLIALLEATYEAGIA